MLARRSFCAPVTYFHFDMVAKGDLKPPLRPFLKIMSCWCSDLYWGCQLESR